MRHTVVLCISSISPMSVGCFICVNINLVIVLTKISNVIMSGILFKMLVLGIMLNVMKVFFYYMFYPNTIIL